MKIANIGWGCLHDATMVAVTTPRVSGETCVRVRLCEEAARDAEVHVTEPT
ncbi:hypothetical protein [Myxococcus stipitatus]|uniref:hypothetical protein n=1 Tax=Myxococcus stipitatus TaxID=83455 RepID=UPI00146ED891|nr:hypothetical protein [Myxococcus stipitatus]